MMTVILLVLMILARFKVSGHSMLPTLKPNQEVLVSSLPFLFAKPKTNDLVAFKEKDKFIIKRIKKQKSGNYLLEGDNKNDSKNYWIEQNKILGKVIYIHS